MHNITGEYSCNGFHTLNAGVPPDPGMSTGAKAGLGVGVGTAVLGLLVAIRIYIRRRKNKNSTTSASKDTGFEKPEIDGVEKRPMEMDNEGETFEIGGDGPNTGEMPTGIEAQELAGEHGLSEVGTDEEPGVRVVRGTHELPS